MNETFSPKNKLLVKMGLKKSSTCDLDELYFKNILESPNNQDIINRNLKDKGLQRNKKEYNTETIMKEFK